jgi:transposase
MAERILFSDYISTLPAHRVVVVDESSTHMGMTPTYARAPRGQRAYASNLRNYGHNVTLLAGLRLAAAGKQAMPASMVIEGAVDTTVFEVYVREVLAPTLSAGDVVVMDNLSCHKAKSITALIEATGAVILWLPRYSPDLSPIEHAFSKLKAYLRRAKAETVDTLLAAIARALDLITTNDTIGWFTHCGFLNLDHATWNPL